VVHSFPNSTANLYFYPKTVLAARLNPRKIQGKTKSRSRLAKRLKDELFALIEQWTTFYSKSAF